MRPRRAAGLSGRPLNAGVRCMGTLRSSATRISATLVALVLLVSFAESRYTFAAKGGPVLTPAEVAAIAGAAMTRAGHAASDFKVHTRTFDARRSKWRVFFGQVPKTVKVDGKYVSSVMIDGEMLVVVDDTTRGVCVQQAMAVGPCT